MSVYFQCIVKGCPPSFAQHGKVLEILGDDYFRVKTRSIEKLRTVVDYIEPLNLKITHNDPLNDVIVTHQNLAEILPVTLDDHTILQREYDAYVKTLQVGCNRLYLKLPELSSYFRNLLKQIIELIDLPYLDITLQIHDKRIFPEHIHLDVPHIDFYRYTNITVPIYFNPNERINYHPNSNKEQILHSSAYSITHPSMVNVGLFHSVSLIPDMTRVLLQLSYLHKFDEIYNRNPSIFKVYT